jgi:hypothetical protein
MTSVAFGAELTIHQIAYLEISSFPSLTLIADANPPQTLIPYSREAHNGETWAIEQTFQTMYVVDAFETCVTWPVTFELVSPVESTALGKCSFEVQPLICDAIAAHGSSPVASQSAVLRDFERREVAVLAFDLRIIFFKMCLKRAATETRHTRNLTPTAIARITGADSGRQSARDGIPRTASHETIEAGPSFQSSEERLQSPRSPPNTI